MICGQCGAENAEYCTYCVGCGLPLTQQKKKPLLRYLIPALAAAAALALAAYWIFC